MTSYIGKYLVYGGGELAPDGLGGFVTVPNNIYSYIQLWNPADSGVNVELDVIEIMNGLKDSDVLFYFTQTIVPTYKGKWWNLQPPQVNGKLEFRAGISGDHIHPYPDENNTNIFYQRWLKATSMWKKKFVKALVIPPGWGLNAEHSVKDNALMLNVEGREVVP